MSDETSVGGGGGGVLGVLTPEALDVLRGGYRPEAMASATKQALNARYAGGAPFVDTIVDTLYAGAPIAASDRERCLVALLAARGEGLTLAVHLYWALMEGLPVEEVAHVLVLAGAYMGVPAYANGLLVLERTLKALKPLAAAGGDAAMSPAVLQKLLADFR